MNKVRDRRPETGLGGEDLERLAGRSGCVISKWGDESYWVLGSQCLRVVMPPCRLGVSGISIVLKLNGRVGQRAFGLPNWQNLNLDVEDRRIRGYDITSI